MTVIDFKSRKTILVEDVEDEYNVEDVLDAVETENVSEIVVITIDNEGQVRVRSNDVGRRDLIYILELTKQGMMTYDEVEG